MASTVAGWVALPFDPKVVDAIEPGLSEALALDAPIEFAVALPPGNVTDVVPNVVISFGLASTAKAKSLLENYNGSALKEQAPGVWVSGDDARTHCAIAPSLGKTTARIVCGSESSALRELLPYATRGLPLEDLGSADMRAEIRVKALQNRYAAAARAGKTLAVPALLKLVALDDPKFDRPLSDAAHAFGDELLDWFQDLDRITIDLTAQSKPDQVTAKFGLSHQGHRSFTATAAVSAKGRMTSPGPLFFDLPATVTRADYFAPSDPKLLERPKMLSNALVDGFLAHLEVSSALRREVTSALDGVLSQGHGAVWGEVPVALPPKPAKATEADLFSSLVGCHVVGIDGPAAPYQAALKAWVKLDNDRAFKKGIEQLLTQKLEAAAPSRAKEGKSKPAKPPPPKKPFSELLKIKAKNVTGMPAGSEVAAIVFEAKATEAVVTETQKKLQHRSKLPKVGMDIATVYVAVVPDGARSWVLVTADEKLLVEQAKAVLTGSNAPRLSTRNDLATLRGTMASRAGFISLLRFKPWLEGALHTKDKPTKEAETLYSTLPHHGSTPIFFKVIATGDEQRPVLESSIVIPREVFDDVAASVPALMMTF
jgi:hypothetical protein